MSQYKTSAKEVGEREHMAAVENLLLDRERKLVDHLVPPL